MPTEYAARILKLRLPQQKALKDAPERQIDKLKALLSELEKTAQKKTAAASKA
jgi:hypothetical protein